MKVDMPWSEDTAIHTASSPLVNLRAGSTQLAGAEYDLIGPFELTTDKQGLVVAVCTVIIFDLEGRAFAVITFNREKHSDRRRARTSFNQDTHRNLFDAPQTKTNVNYIY
jgi:hypothetical protein